MAAILSKYQIIWTNEANVAYSFFFLAPPDHYEAIQNETGITKLADDDPLLDMPVTKTGELAISPVASRKTLRYVVNGKKKYADILVSASKANTVQNELVEKAFKGGTIERVLDPRKATKF